MGTVVFLSKMVPEEHREWVERNRIRGMFSSAVALQQKLLAGFDALIGEDLVVCNVEPVSNFPQHFRKMRVPGFRYDHTGGGGRQDYNVAFNNTVGLKQKSMERGVARTLERIGREREISALVIYTPTGFFLNAACRYAKRHPDLHICLIIPDLPDFANLAEHISIKTRMLMWLNNRSIQRAFARINSLVVLTAQTAEYLHWQGKPFAVVEGIASAPPVVTAPQPEHPTIVYTGTTHRQFGIPVLLDAFARIKDPDVRLVVCGEGDYDGELCRLAQQDSRIRFLGVVSHEQAIRLQHQATVLVNPRQNIGEYTKYSFPSKTMEYLVTGAPVVAYRLDGMPEEYFDYLCIPADNTPRALAGTISEILSMSGEERRDMGRRGREYVLTHKNPKQQVQKIVDLINGR